MTRLDQRFTASRNFECSLHLLPVNFAQSSLNFKETHCTLGFNSTRTTRC